MPEQMITFDYNREKAVAYADEWAYRRNPRFLDFQELGGDCTNFASQCIYAGAGIMNYTPVYGWFYITGNNRTASWTGVQFLYNFLTTNQGVGPFGHEVGIEDIRPGDICQLNIFEGRFHHSPVIVSTGEVPTLDNTLVAAHSRDVNCRQISTYKYVAIRFIHIDGVRTVRGS